MVRLALTLIVVFGLMLPILASAEEGVWILYPNKSTVPVVEVGQHSDYAVIVKYELSTTPSAFLDLSILLDGQKIGTKTFEVLLGHGRKKVDFPINISTQHKELEISAVLFPDGAPEPYVDKLKIPCVLPDFLVTAIYDQEAIQLNGSAVKIDLAFKHLDGTPIRYRKFIIETSDTASPLEADALNAAKAMRVTVNTDDNGRIMVNYIPPSVNDPMMLKSVKFPLIRTLGIKEGGIENRRIIQLVINSAERISEIKETPTAKTLLKTAPGKATLNKIGTFSDTQMTVMKKTFPKGHEQFIVKAEFKNFSPGEDSLEAVLVQSGIKKVRLNCFPDDTNGYCLFEFKRPVTGWTGEFDVVMYRIDNNFKESELGKITVFIEK